MAIRSLESRFREIGGGGGEDAGRVSSDGGRRGEGRRKEEERGEVEGVSGHVYGVERCQICRARARWRVSSPVDQLELCCSTLARFSRDSSLSIPSFLVETGLNTNIR